MLRHAIKFKIGIITMKNIIIITSFILCFQTVSFCETFYIGLPIVQEFNPISNQINSLSYISFHLYYKMFYFDDQQNISSKILDMNKTKALDTSFTNFRFCIKPNLKFSDGSNVQSDDLEASLKYLLQIQTNLLKIRTILIESQNCLILKLDQTTPNLFKKMIGGGSTILKKSDVNKMLPIGIGPYRISQINNNEIRLNYIENNKVRFNEIVFKAVKSANDLDKRSFQDLNQLPVILSGLPKEYNSYKEYNFPSMKVYSYVINLPKESDRLCVQSILSMGDWPSKYGLDLELQNSFLPWIDKNLIQRSFNTRKCKSMSTKIDFLIANIYKSNSVADEITKINKNLKIKKHILSGNEFAKWVFSNKPYVALLSFDNGLVSLIGIENYYYNYFQAFISPEYRIVSHPINDLKQLVDQFKNHKNGLGSVDSIAKKAEDILINKGWILPVGRLNSKFKYPANLKIQQWFDKLNGIPDISTIY